MTGPIWLGLFVGAIVFIVGHLIAWIVGGLRTAHRVQTNEEPVIWATPHPHEPSLKIATAVRIEPMIIEPDKPGSITTDEPESAATNKPKTPALRTQGPDRKPLL